MAPTLAPNSFVVSTLSNNLFNEVKPKLGEIYIFRPKNFKDKLIKRLVAVGNDEVWIENGIVFVNAENQSVKFNLPTISQAQALTCKYFAKTKVPENTYFFLGDNLCEALDSRKFGGITDSEIIGRVVYWFKL